MIADGSWAPGQRILRQTLARDMGVSRTPCVNALKRLPQERLVEWVSRRGIYVTQFSLMENLHLAAAMESVNMMISAYQIGVPRSLAESLPQHQAILEVLGHRDPDANEAAMRIRIRSGFPFDSLPALMLLVKCNISGSVVP